MVSRFGALRNADVADYSRQVGLLPLTWSSPQRTVQRCFRLLAFQNRTEFLVRQNTRNGVSGARDGPGRMISAMARIGAATPVCPDAGLGRRDSSWQKAACSPQAESAAPGRGLATRHPGDCWCDGLFSTAIDFGRSAGFQNVGQGTFRSEE